MSESKKPGDADRQEPLTQRLESWKEIASYLDRSTRTVRRWERDEGLPVHRHRHSKGSTVFAHAQELDRWLRSRVSRGHEVEPPKVEQPAGVPPDHMAPPDRMPMRAVAMSSALALVMATVALIVSLSAEDPVGTIPVEQRLLLEASYFESRGDHAAALRTVEAALGVGPVGREIVELAVRSCGAVDEAVRCADLVRRAADHSPRDAVLQAMAARELALSAGRLDEGLEYADRSRALSRTGAHVLEPELLAFVELLAARKAWLDGDVVRALAELDRVAEGAERLDGVRRDAVARASGWHCLAMGRIGCADEWFSLVGDPIERHELESYALFAAGRMDGLRDHLARSTEYRHPETAILLAMSGAGAAAERLIDDLRERAGDAGALEVARGGLDLLAGRPMEAVVRLESGLPAVRPPGSGMRFIGLDMLSMIAEKSGEVDRAVELLEMTDEEREHAILQGSGLFWIKCQTRLAGVYRGMDRIEDARRVERELLTALALSDPEHPTTAALKRATA